jgi:ATP-binding cassette subfamily B protein
MNHMGMGMGGGGGGRVGFSLMRSLRRDQNVTAHKLPKGTVKRIMGFAKPYKLALALFLVLIIIDALVGAANPLVYRAIIDQGIEKHKGSLVIWLAVLVAGLAIFDAALGLWERWISSRVGEGLIFDMRNKVFIHIQRMPIAFFTRTQTGALISRLNNDVLGAQQAFTDTFNSVIGNSISLAVTLIAMLILSWQITLLALCLLPVFIFPARWVGRRLAAITREAYNLNAEMNTMMSERFNVAGALLVKIFGKPKYEAEMFEARTGRVRDIGVTTAMYGRVFFTGLMLTATLATAMVYGVGGVAAAHGHLPLGTLVALTLYLTRLYGPLTALSNVQVDVMTALVSFDRVFEVLDLPPMIDDKPGAVDVVRGPAQVAFEHVDFRYPTAEEVSLASLEAVAVLERTGGQQILFDVSFVAEPGQLVALVGPSGAGKTTISQLAARLYDVTAGFGQHERHGRAGRHLELVAGRRRRRHPRRPSFPRLHQGQLALRAARRHRRRAQGGAAGRANLRHGGVAAQRPRHPCRGQGLSTFWWRKAAHRDSPVAPEGPRCSRARRSDRSPRF